MNKEYGVYEAVRRPDGKIENLHYGVDYIAATSAREAVRKYWAKNRLYLASDANVLVATDSEGDTFCLRLR